MFLRIYFLLVLGLDSEVGLAPDDVPISCSGDSLMRLLRDNQVEKSLIHFFLHYSVEDTDLICIASVRLSLVYTCGLPVLFFVQFFALGLCPTNSFLRLTRL